MTGFEGSFLGDADRISSDTVMECGVCWWVYDPDQGDAVWQIAPGTAFADLPGHWRCPNCDAAPHQFMVLRAGSGHAHPPRAAGLELIDEQTLAIERAYRRVAEHMRTLPVYNGALDIHVTGMRRCAHGLICVAATPWCMNLLLLPNPGETGREGTSRALAFPSGSYAFIAGQLGGVGIIETCSLFSPMEQFDDPGVVREVAGHVISGLFQAPQPAPERDRPLSRRQFLRPGLAE